MGRTEQLFYWLTRRLHRGGRGAGERDKQEKPRRGITHSKTHGSVGPAPTATGSRGKQGGRIRVAKPEAPPMPARRRKAGHHLFWPCPATWTSCHRAGPPSEALWELWGPGKDRAWGPARTSVRRQRPIPTGLSVGRWVTGCVGFQRPAEWLTLNPWPSSECCGLAGSAQAHSWPAGG